MRSIATDEVAWYASDHDAVWGDLFGTKLENHELDGVSIYHAKRHFLGGTYTGPYAYWKVQDGVVWTKAGPVT